jgi:hypothetical protein
VIRVTSSATKLYPRSIKPSKNGDFGRLGHRQQFRRKMKTAGDHQTRNFAFAKLANSLNARFLGKALQIGMFGRAQNLDALLREITVEAGKGQTRTIDRRLANFSMKADARSFQFHLQLLGVRIVKTFDRYHRHRFFARSPRGSIGRCRYRCR